MTILINAATRRLCALSCTVLYSGAMLADHFTDDMITSRIDQMGGVAAYQQDVATKLNRLYPRPLGSLLEATAVQADGSDLVYTAHLVQAAPEVTQADALQGALRSDLQPLMCDNQATRPLIYLYAAHYRVQVVDGSGEPLATLDFNSESCHAGAAGSND